MNSKLLLFVPLFLSNVSFAQPGSLDNTFGTNGKVMTSIVYSDRASAMVIQNDGKIVLAGTTSDGSTDLFSLVRYNSNGSLDNSFDGDGKVTTNFGGWGAIATSMAIQNDGKIVVAGIYNPGTGSTQFAVARYNTDGSPDLSFDGDGRATTQVSQNAQANAVAIQSDGKILVAGSAFGSSDDFALARYNSNGSLDNSLDIDGKMTTSISGGEDAIKAIALQPDGKIIAVGFATTGISHIFALARYNSNGILDNSFNGNGMVFTAVSGNNSQANAIALQADGKIVVAGEAQVGSYFQFGLARYLPNGALDNSFDSDGKLTTMVSSTENEATSLAIQADGKILAAGSVYHFGDHFTDFGVVRYLSTGVLDAGFDNDGIATFNLGDDELCTAMKLVGNRIYLSGYTDVNNGTNDFALMAVKNDGLPLITGITEINRLAEMKLFPNPSTETITIELNRRERALVQIINASGSCVLQEEIPAVDASTRTFNIRHLSVGEYRVVVHQKSGSKQGGFVRVN